MLSNNQLRKRRNRTLWKFDWNIMLPLDFIFLYLILEVMTHSRRAVSCEIDTLRGLWFNKLVNKYLFYWDSRNKKCSLNFYLLLMCFLFERINFWLKKSLQSSQKFWRILGVHTSESSTLRFSARSEWIYCKCSFFIDQRWKS